MTQCNEHLQVKLTEQKSLLCDTPGLPMTEEVLKRQEKNKNLNVTCQCSKCDRNYMLSQTKYNGKPTTILEVGSSLRRNRKNNVKPNIPWF